MALRSLAPSLALVALLSLAGGPASALTVVLDFGAGDDHAGDAMTAYDAAPFGFVGLDQAGSQAAVLAAVRDHYLGFPTAGADPFSPIPEGQELALDFVIGTRGIAPANGDVDWYVFALGESAVGKTYLGEAYYQSIRGPDYPSAPAGSLVGAVYTDRIATLAGLAADDAQRINLIAGTASHEIGHALGLLHPAGPAANPGASAWSVMATGAAPSNMPNGERVLAREFSYAEAATLVENIGLRAVPLPAPALLMALGVAALTLAARPRAA